MSDISISIIQQVKDELQIDKNLTPEELYTLLHKHRSNNHPDKYTDSKLKKEAEEKFKKVNSLLKELEFYIQKENLNQSSNQLRTLEPRELILHQANFEVIQLKQQIISLEENVKSLTKDNGCKDSKIENLEKVLNKERDKALDEKTLDLINLYKPTNKNLFSLGISIVLTLLLGVLSKVEEVANLLNKYSPFNPTTFKYIVFFILVFFILRYVKKSLEGNRIEFLAKKIKTVIIINKFLSYLEANDIEDSFTEMHVYDFLQKEIKSKNHILRFLYSNLLHLYNEATIDSLKDIFIYNLINRKLINISNANKLNRKFKIKKSNYYFDDYDFPF